jgi:hypothetical protein
MARFRCPTLALVLASVLIAVLLGGCMLLRPPPPPDPLGDYRAALNSDFEPPAYLVQALPQYSITATIDPVERIYTGTLDLTLPVTGTAPLGELYFRLYPNLPQFGGRMEIVGARIDEAPVNYSYEAEGTAVHLSLPKPLQLGRTVKVGLNFTGFAPKRYSGYYTIFGFSDDVLSLDGFYPILAGRRNGAWALDVASPQGDVGFHDAAFYRVDLITPLDQVIAATGTVITQTQNAAGLRMTRYVLGPAREFGLLMSPRFQVEEAETLGTRVRSYALPEDAVAAHSALYDAVAALQIYHDRFGLYPYRDMSVVQAPLNYRGMEFPGMSLIGNQTYNEYLQNLETLVVHEVAHQWWYNQVGSDQPESPWLDEGLAEFSMYYYYLDRYGAPTAQHLREVRWEFPVDRAKAQGVDAPIGQPVTAYTDNYETIVYGKGALFFLALRDQIGADAFQKLLRTYLERYRWKIASPADFQAVAEEVSGQDLSALFQQWVSGK